MERNFGWGNVFKNHLVEDVIPRAILNLKPFIIEDLTEIFSQCVECKFVPRKETDRRTAEYLADQLEKGYFSLLTDMAKRAVVLKAYDIQRQEQTAGHKLPEISEEIINGTWNEKTFLLAISDYLCSLPFERMYYLIDRASMEIFWDRKFAKLAVGRFVWNYIYRPTVEIIGGSYPPWFRLHPDLYGEVWFGRTP